MANTLSPATAELAGAAPVRVREKQGIRWGRIAAWAVMGLILFVDPVPVLVDAPHRAVHQRGPRHAATSRCCRSTRRC